MKGILILLALWACCSCNSTGRNKPYAGTTATAISDTAAKLARLLSVPDSFPVYIKLNKQLYNSLAVINNLQAGDQYLDNIIRQHERAVKDTALKKILAYAYYNKGEDIFKTAYDEETVRVFEQFMLLANTDSLQYSRLAAAANFLGIQYNILGDVKKSLYYYTECTNYALLNKDYDKYASGIINMTVALNEMELCDSTIRLIKATLLFKGIASKRLASLYANLATAQSKKHLYTEAFINAQVSLGIIKKIAPSDIDQHILEKKYQMLWNLAEIQSLSGNSITAARTMDLALHEAFICYDSSFKNRETGKLMIARGRIAENAGQLQQALSYYHKALCAVTDVDTGNTSMLPGKQELYAENTIMEALDAKADLLLKIYSKSKEAATLQLAVHCYELSFEVENKLMRSFSYDESLARQAVESRQRSEKAITACHQLYQLTQQPAWAEKAFLFAEKSKAVVLHESVRKNIAAGNMQNDTLLQKVRLQQQRIAYFERLLYENKDAAAIPSITHNKYLAENQLLTAETALMHGRNTYREALLKPDALSIPQLQNKLAGNATVLVEFFEGENNTWAFIVSKHLPVRFLQYDFTIAKLTDTLLEYFTDASLISNDPAGFEQTAYQLYRALQWQPSGESWKQVIIIPDGRLSFLPFDALVTSPSVSHDLQQAAYLLRQYELSYTYSAAILLKQEEQPGNAAGGLMAFAPVFLNHERQQQPLPNSKAEINSIISRTNGKKYISGNASLSNFKKAFAHAGILHIATHAYADTSASGMPRIELIDSSLLLNELYACKTNAALVVLSGCETGIGKISKSEGPLSLARGFYYAGAASVITSYWRVDDKSTAGLFSNFYRNIHTQPYSTALHHAKLDFIKQASPTTASPYYWAGFVYIGQLQNAGNIKPPHWWWLF